MHVPNRDSNTAESTTSTATNVLLWLLRAYKVFFSQIFTGSCRFVPSCSSYAEEALIKHGTLRGSWLTVLRLARCHPFCESGLDQVPEPRRPQQR